MVEVPVQSNGFCECGCGKPTIVSKYTDNRDGYVKGQARRFISGHNGRRTEFWQMSGPNPSGLCECGCGERTKQSRRRGANYERIVMSTITSTEVDVNIRISRDGMSEAEVLCLARAAIRKHFKGALILGSIPLEIIAIERAGD
jgi:hypothetical protein